MTLPRTVINARDFVAWLSDLGFDIKSLDDAMIYRLWRDWFCSTFSRHLAPRARVARDIKLLDVNCAR